MNKELLTDFMDAFCPKAADHFKWSNVFKPFSTDYGKKEIQEESDAKKKKQMSFRRNGSIAMNIIWLFMIVFLAVMTIIHLWKRGIGLIVAWLVIQLSMWALAGIIIQTRRPLFRRKSGRKRSIDLNDQHPYRNDDILQHFSDIMSGIKETLPGGKMDAYRAKAFIEKIYNCRTLLKDGVNNKEALAEWIRCRFPECFDGNYSGRVIMKAEKTDWNAAKQIEEWAGTKVDDLIDQCGAKK